MSFISTISVSSTFKLFAQKVHQATDALYESRCVESAAELAFYILDGATTALGQLVPEVKPKSITEVLQQATEQGSAILCTRNHGNILIEISFDKEGRRFFKATDEFYQPVVFHESKKRTGSVVWEAKVTSYLQKYFSDTSTVDYGANKRRWTGDKWAELKKHFAMQGLLTEKGSKVTLKLPGEAPFIFQAPFVHQKAEIVLKHFYQREKTPQEEIASRPWDIANKLFLGYLYCSGFLLAPWIRDHVALPHQLAKAEDEKANQFALDGFLSEAELDEMAKNPSLCQKVIDIAYARDRTDLLDQLEKITFTPNGYTQTSHYDGTTYEDHHHYTQSKETHHRKACNENSCEEYHVEQTKEKLILTKKVSHSTHYEVEQKILTRRTGEEWTVDKEEAYQEPFILPDAKTHSHTAAIPHQALTFATAYAATLLTVKDPRVALIASLFTFLPKTKAIPVADLTHNIELPKPQLTNLSRRTGEAAKSSLARRVNPITIITPLPDLTATPGVLLNDNIDLRQYYELSNINGNRELSMRQTSGAALPSWLTLTMGDISLVKTFYLGGEARDIFISGKYAYVALANAMKIVDISNPSNPVVVGTWVNSGSPGGFIYVKGNYAFYGTPCGSAYCSPANVEIIDITNPASPTLITTISYINISFMTAVGNYIYLGKSDYYGGPGNYLRIFDISNPSNPIQKGTLNWGPYTLSGMNVIGNYAYAGNYGLYNFNIIDISNPSNPVSVTSVSVSLDVFSFVGKNNYIFVGTNSDVKIYDISQITSPILVYTVYIGTTVNRLTINGNYLYASCGDGGEKIINIENVLSSQLVSSFTTFGQAKSAFFSGDYGFIADGGAGLTIYDVSERTLAGRPASTDRGLLKITATASDGSGNSVTDPFVIHVGDINVTPIPNQQIYVGSTTMYTVLAGTFEYPGATFTYSATLAGGVPLPSFIGFDSSSRTFIFAPQSGNQNSYTIVVKADDGYGGIKTTSFVLSVPDRPPVLEQPLQAQIAYSLQLFEYIFSSSTFSDLDRDTLSYSAVLSGTTALPGWLNFDPALRRFYGTPYGKGTYVIVVTANDGFGGTATASFTITVPSSAPIVQNQIGTQLASTGIPYTYPVPTNTFFDIDGDHLTLSTDPLPSFLQFNATINTFWGTPQNTDIGTYSITLQAEDTSAGRVSTSFSLTVLSSSNNFPPVVMKGILDQTESVGIPFSFTFDADTFVDPEGQELRYEAFLEGGVPLPEGLYFDSDTRTLTGQLETPQSLRITIKAIDQPGAFAVDTFALNIVDNQKPIVLNDLPDETADVGVKFLWQLPTNTFEKNDQLKITILQAGGKPLPQWLKYDKAKNTLEGTPGPGDTGTYVDAYVHLEVWGTVANSSTKVPFTIIVQGESYWETFIKVGLSLSSIIGTGYTIYQSRALIGNFLRKKKYQKEEERAMIGKDYEHLFNFTVNFSGKLAKVIAYEDGHPLPHERKLPSGLLYDEDNHKITGKATGKDKGRFTIEAKDHEGNILEQYELIIKNEDDDDPVKVDYLAQIKSKLIPYLPKQRKDDEEAGNFGKAKKSIFMESLLEKK